EQLPVVFEWLKNMLVADKVVEEIQSSVKKIAGLVSAMKNFTYMDQGMDKQFINIHQGIRDSLTVLTHKLKKSGVEVLEEYDTSLPKIKALPGQLNQIWTNLLDNAIDALSGKDKPQIKITTQKDGGCVEVIITDNGPGVPQEIQSRVFEPFFTTKEIGKGTGLGLDVVSQIVRFHRGSVKLSSVPGKTSFSVSFPQNS
ncbi:MAG TPA: HAMP domain-containing sensor histidine kinase, partial [Chitinophaga sp.]|uniref:sensor histidine kinase n=1 Tax=Chitinophaga sp. TaxID=1869181 RepID=UPI002C56CF65